MNTFITIIGVIIYLFICYLFGWFILAFTSIENDTLGKKILRFFIGFAVSTWLYFVLR
ncbi:Uncharacterised protein [Chryseobacterium taihuense]|uniref:Uncharacterized protein n=1 Tax=Chryseobacterium taihuense TaxID=1141221 RepID=A0A4V6IDF2_9FLAO|nr:Uncharacterised protein [Chryseobacterium taihuense]